MLSSGEYLIIMVASKLTTDAFQNIHCSHVWVVLIRGILADGFGDAAQKGLRRASGWYQEEVGERHSRVRRGSGGRRDKDQ